MRVRVFSSGLLLALVACATPSGTGQPDDSPTPTPAASETPAPTASARPEEMPTPAASPSVTPEATPESEPTPVTTTVPVPENTPSPVDLVDPNLLQGTVYDGLNKPLGGVNVRVQSQDPLFDQSFVTDANGRYTFNEVPTGALLDITASRTGYASRKRLEILTSRPLLELHTFDFARFIDNETSLDYRLQQAPEVSQVTFTSVKGEPIEVTSRTLLPRDVIMTLKFSEPMQTETVTSAFLIEEINPDKTTSETYNQFDFIFTWNIAVDTVQVKMKSEPGWLPTDATYRLSFTRGSGSIHDKSGTPRTANYFKVNALDLSPSFEFKVRSK